MNAIQCWVSSRWLVGLTFALVAADTPRTADQPEKGPTLIIDSASLDERDIFNVRFKKVDIQACKIWDVVVSLAEEIEKISKGKRHFEVFLESSRIEKYTDQHIPTSEWEFSGPKISLTGSNMTLEAIINTLCLKAGWSYDDRTSVGTMFTNSKRLPKPKR